jgi:cytochrome c-type biogenesis protein CcmE
MDEPEKYSEGRIHLRGAVGNGSIGDDSTFVLEGTGLNLRVSTSSIPIPEGFEEGKTVAVKGSLVKDAEGWILRADEIKTGCPSKYESAE